MTRAVAVIGANMQNMQTIRVMPHPLGAVSSSFGNLIVITLLAAGHSYDTVRMNHTSIRRII